MNERNRGGKELGGVKGQGQSGPCTGCLCPKCGYCQPHELDVPCTQIKCPRCGKAMMIPA